MRIKMQFITINYHFKNIEPAAIPTVHSTEVLYTSLKYIWSRKTIRRNVNVQLL